MNTNTIYNIDCLEGLRQLDAKSINLIVTSPPYNVSKEYNSYDDNKPYNQYIDWMTTIFEECYRVLADDGRMVINIGDGKNGSIPTHSDFIQRCLSIGFKVMTIIIWNKNTTSNRTAWGSFQSPSAPSFPRGFEYIIFFSKSPKLTHKGEITIKKEDFITWSNGLWTFAPARLKEIGHPAAFPIELPRRCIELLTYKNDVVLDIFNGSGQTSIAAILTNRQYIGFEMDKEYFDLSLQRIDDFLTKQRQTT